MDTLASEFVIVECVADRDACHPFLALRAGEIPDFEGAALLLADPQFLETCDLLASLTTLMRRGDGAVSPSIDAILATMDRTVGSGPSA